METQSASKKYRSISVLLGVVCIALIIIVLLQYRHNTELKSTSNKIALSDKSQSGFKAVDPLSKMTVTPDSISDKEKIKNLKSQIADMQEWQDYLEEKLAKYEMTSEERLYNGIYNVTKSNNSSRFAPFFDENNISPDQKTEFIELLAQKELERVHLDRNSMSTEEYQKEEEKINSKYDDLISNLLSEENYIAYQDFLKSEEDRPLIGWFNEYAFTGDSQLNKQQEKELLTAISSKRLYIENTEGILMNHREKEQSQSPEYMARWFKAQKKLWNGYLELSKDILTDSQIDKFEKYINNQISSIERYEKDNSQMLELMNSDTEKAEN